MKLKYLEERLQCLSEFERPKVSLEQYVTPSHLGSHILYTIQVKNTIINAYIIVISIILYF